MNIALIPKSSMLHVNCKLYVGSFKKDLYAASEKVEFNGYFAKEKKSYETWLSRLKKMSFLFASSLNKGN